MVAIADPGVGRETDPIGSVGWAQRVRLRMQGIVNDVDTKPDALRRYVDMVKQHRAWTLMNKADGTCFKAWEEFCETRQPWGLGKPWEELRPYVEAVAGKAAVALATVSAPQVGGRGNVATRLQGNHETDRILRAILRAPIEVQDLYREELISQKVAAKLGPKDPSKAPSRERVVEALASVPRERKAIDGAVRDLLGQKRDRVSELVRAFLRLDAKQRRRFYDEVEKAAK